METNTKAHLLAFLTAFIWGTTFVAIKKLQIHYNPWEIILYRFIIAYIFLLLIKPKRLNHVSFRKNNIFLVAGLTGVCLYFMLESMALSMSLASVVGVLVSVGPIFTALITCLILRQGKLKLKFMLGLMVALLGIIVVSIRGVDLNNSNWIGNILAVLAAFMWAIYSIISSKISQKYEDILLCTRRVIFYGIIFLLIYNVGVKKIHFTIPEYSDVLYMIYLGVGASALCFIMWNFALSKLGPKKTSVYIYLVPVISIISSSIILREDINILMIIGTICTLSGLVICEI